MPSQARPPSRAPVVVRARAFHLHSSPLRPTSTAGTTTSGRLPPPPLLFSAGASPTGISRHRLTRRAPHSRESTPTPQPGSAAAGSPPTKRQKLPIYSTPAGGSWLRSGRNGAYKAVHEAATMQVQSMAAFKLAEPEDLNAVGSQTTDSSSSEASEMPSSQATVTEPSWSPSPTPSSLPGTPLDVTSSQTETIASWTPQRLNSRELREQYDIPAWVSEVLESDEYDSDTMSFLEQYRRSTSSTQASEPSTPSRPQTSSTLSPSPRFKRTRRSQAAPTHSPLPSQEQASLSSQPQSVASSPGFVVLENEEPRRARDEWMPEPWPADIRRITSQLNPRNWRFSPAAAGGHGGQACACVTRCTAMSCINARRGCFCTVSNCSFAGTCGNALQESSNLQLSRNSRTGVRGVTANASIPRGEVIGEYLGLLQLFGPPCQNAPANDGYRMHLNTRTTGNRYVGIDAAEAGGMSRFMNHSCNAAAKFHEVHTGRMLTVVVVTIRDVWPGEEVTVDYGDSLWFLCRCGWWGCQHRHLQGLPDVMSASTA